MTLEQELHDALKRAMLDKDQRTADVVRMVKSRMQERPQRIEERNP